MSLEYSDKIRIVNNDIDHFMIDRKYRNQIILGTEKDGELFMLMFSADKSDTREFFESETEVLLQTYDNFNIDFEKIVNDFENWGIKAAQDQTFYAAFKNFFDKSVKEWKSENWKTYKQKFQNDKNRIRKLVKMGVERFEEKQGRKIQPLSENLGGLKFKDVFNF